MNKKLMAVAVAGALAVPGIALAQSTVTISGFIKLSADNISYSGATTNPLGVVPGGVGGGRYGNTSEYRLSDNSSRIIFGIREDLGNNLAAVGQIDMRFNPADNAAPIGNGAIGSSGQLSAAGNTWVGLDSKSWGRITAGRWDLHYGKSGDDWNAAGAGSLQAWGSSLFDVVARPGALATPAVAGTAVPTTSNASIANQTRTNSVIRYDTPNWGGFDAIIAWSANPLSNSGASTTGGDLGGATICTGALGCASTASGVIGTGGNAGTTISRKGSGWNINPRYTASNWGVEYSYWTAKADATTASVQWTNLQTGAAPVLTQSAIPDDQLSQTLKGYFAMAGWKVGLAYNTSKTTNVASGLVSGDRTAWALPISYTTGPHLIGYNYVKANNSKDTCTATAAGVVTCVSGNGSNTGATMNTLTYQYELSKRTSLGLTYSQIANQANAAYGFFFNASTAFGSNNSGSFAGEKNRLLAATIMHKF